MNIRSIIFQRTKCSYAGGPSSSRKICDRKICGEKFARAHLFVHVKNTCLVGRLSNARENGGLANKRPPLPGPLLQRRRGSYAAAVPLSPSGGAGEIFPKNSHIEPRTAASGNSVR